MGKLFVLLTAAAMIVSSIMMLQTEQQTLNTDRSQTDRQEEILAREIARSGYNTLLARANALRISDPTMSLADLMGQVNGSSGLREGVYQGGRYEARIADTSGTSFFIVSEGFYGEASHRIGHQEQLHVAPPSPRVPSRLSARFLDSQAGWCSAIYLQRMIPRTGPDAMPADSISLPIEASFDFNGITYAALTPELVYTAGRNRDGAESHHDSIIQPGTLLNFILAVDKNCSLQGQEVPITAGYDHQHAAFDLPSAGTEDMQEGKYAMTEPHPTLDGHWRIAFEDQKKFSDDQHRDVKINGYGDRNWSERADGQYSYGGSGWTQRDDDGYYKLRNYGNVPDFSDQTFEITLTPVTSGEETA